MNPAQLKLELIRNGIRPSAGLPDPLANPFGLVHLVLPGKVPVSTHVNDEAHRVSPYTLSCEQGLFHVSFTDRDQAQKIPVRWTSPLKSYGRKTSSGVFVGDILTVHGGFIAVHPRGPCRFGRSGLSCRYCGSTRELSGHPPFSKRDLIEALHIVLEEKRCDFVHLSSGHVETPDGGLEWLAPWVSEIRKHVNIMISLNLVPPATNEWIDQTYAVGVDALYYDTDFFDPNAPEATQRGRKSAHHERHLEALAYASKIFPSGAVLSHVVIGFEPLEDTRKHIDELIDRGVVPLLVYFPPYEGTELAARWTVAPADSTNLYAHLFERIVKTRIMPHWVQQFDVLVTPLEGRFFSPESPRYHLFLKNFFESHLGRLTRFGLSSLRRHLRVREVPLTEREKQT